MKKTTFIPLMAMAAAVCLATSCGPSDPGALNGEFSISATQKVKFAQGNLRYQPSTKTYMFAENQWEYLSKPRETMKEGDTDFWDLFNWGTGDNPVQKSEKFVDWGKNPIVNGGNEGGIWRTLTGEEWEYLILKREKAGELTAWGIVNNVKGIIVLCDDFKLEGGPKLKPVPADSLRSWSDQMCLKNNKADFSTDNVFTLEEWKKMEEAGAMFLPFNATRFDTFIEGGYWLPSDDYMSICLTSIWPKRGCITNAFQLGVRLAKDIKK